MAESKSLKNANAEKLAMGTKVMLQHAGMNKRTFCHGSGAKGSPEPRVTSKQIVEVLDMYAQKVSSDTKAGPMLLFPVL
jgi:hypothetical protein